LYRVVAAIARRAWRQSMPNVFVRSVRIGTTPRGS
jgi:hypothetical protein